MDFPRLRYLVVLTVATYLAFDYFDTKVVDDEREELIRLKTFELVQRLTTCMYGEILGKIYYRRKF